MDLALALPGVGRLAAEARPESVLGRVLTGGRRRPQRGVGLSGDDSAPRPERATGAASFEALYRAHEAYVLRLCRRMLGTEAGRDASQEVFLRARRGFESWDSSRPFRPWILGVASHHCIDQLRRRRVEAKLFDPSDLDAGELLDSGPSPLRLTQRAEERGRLLEAIDALPRKYRLPLVLRYFEELDYDGIGELLELSRGQVGTLLFRAKRRLRAALEIGSTP